MIRRTGKDGASAIRHEMMSAYKTIVITIQIVALAMLALWLPPASACLTPHVSYLEVAQDSDLVLVGTLHTIRGGQAQFTVEQALKGTAPAPVVTVAPVTNQWITCDRIYQEGETLVVFLKQGAAQGAVENAIFTIMVEGYSALTFKPDTKAATLAAVEHLLKLPSRADKDAVARAMLALATSENSLLRREAHWYLAVHLLDRAHPLKYETELTALLKYPATDVRRTALQGLRFLHSPKALPLIIEISRGDEVQLIFDASAALAPYGTREAVAALIALTRHANPDVRAHALLDLNYINRPEAKAALIALLDDPDPKVRALAPRGLVSWLRRGKVPEVVTKLISMLDDPVPEVQVGAADELGESDSPLAVEPLFRVLKRKELSVELERVAMQTLDLIYSRLDVKARPPARDNLDVVIAVLERDRSYSAYYAIDFLARDATPKAVAALRHAAQNHPQQANRHHAKRALAEMGAG
jgi:HEAT repeat protein